jgi:SAM-dependent methyltransferase
MWVSEHVTQPAAFMREVARVLKPGGCVILFTTNADGVFGRICRLLNRMRVDEMVLRLILPAYARSSDHFPLAMHLNRPGDISLYAQQAGLTDCHYAYADFGGLRGYLHGPLTPLYHLVTRWRISRQNPASLDQLVCLLAKAPADGTGAQTGCAAGTARPASAC